MTNPALTPDDFLTPQEQRLVDCAASGEMWAPDDLPQLGPPTAVQDTARTIRASVIRCLLIGDQWPGRVKPWPVSTNGLMASDAKIEGMLNLDGARLKRTVWLHQCAFTDQIDLTDSKCNTISLRGARLPFGINAIRAAIRGAFILSEAVVTGGIDLQGAEIEGQLDCSGGHFENPNGRALNGDAITVGADVFASTGFLAKGEVNFVRSKILGRLDCSGGHFENPGDRALNCDSMSIGADLFLRSGFLAKGEVNLRGAKIAGQLSCDGGHFVNASGRALNCDATTVSADVFMRANFLAKGEVNFYSATIGGNLRCDAATFVNGGGRAIDLTLAKIGAGLFFTSLKQAGGSKSGLNGQLLLDHATCRTYSDDRASWPAKGNLVLDGFAYERFQNCPTDSAGRREWLELQSEAHLKTTFRPQPWTQAIKVLRDMGHEDDARELAIAREITRTKSDGTKGFQKLWLKLQRRTTGFGYRPRYALYWSCLFFALGWLTFATAANLGYMAPRDGNVVTYLAAHPGAKLPEHFTRFNAPIYALDNYLPIIELGQDQAWEPSDVQSGYRRATDDPWYKEMVRLLLGHDWSVTSTAAAEGPDPVFPVKKQLVHPPSGFLAWMAGGEATLFHYGVHRFVYWALEFLGWIFVSLYIAGMSGVMKDD